MQQQWRLPLERQSELRHRFVGLQKRKLIQYSPAGMRILGEAATLSHTQRCPIVICLCGALESSDSEAA